MKIAEVPHKLNRARRIVSGIIGLRPDDIWLASFPRSGSTWVRFILACMLGIHELSDEIDFDRMNQIMPALGHHDLMVRWPFQTIPRFIKTHHEYHRAFFSRPRRTVLIVRDPRDVMVSYYVHRRNITWSGRWIGSFSDFLGSPRYGLPAYFRHFRSWESHASYILKFEALRQDPAKEMVNMLVSLDIKIPMVVVEEAVLSSSIDRMRSHARTRNRPSYIRKGYSPVRRGKVQGWREVFGEEHLEIYRAYSEKYGYKLHS